MSTTGRTKVFCVGLPKTATTSLTVAMKKLGYHVGHCPNVGSVVKASETHDALTAGTVAPYTEILDRIWSEAKFILTIRDEDSWLESCRKHYSVRMLPKHLGKVHRWNRLAIWGRVSYDETSFKNTGRSHVARVTKYFSSRPSKLLVMDICRGDGYEKLCSFLGCSVVHEQFPHTNRAGA